MSKKQEPQKVIAVTSVKISVAGKDIELTLHDARRLKAALDDLFRERERTTYIPYTPGPLPSAPWRITYGGTTVDQANEFLRSMKP
jgi:hypothetical protein